MGNITKRVAGAALTFAMAGSGLGFIATAASASTVKAGSACTKAQLNKTTKVGKTTYECKKVGKSYKWEKKS